MIETTAEMTLTVDQEIEIEASAQATFEALIARLGDANETPDGKPMSLTLEAWPGGRWYRDLGDKNGHLWGHVQVIKHATLLEITGPLFMSYPVISHLQFRLTEHNGHTCLTLKHRAVGMIDPDHRAAVTGGWLHLLNGIKDHAERH